MIGTVAHRQRHQSRWGLELSVRMVTVPRVKVKKQKKTLGISLGAPGSHIVGVLVLMEEEKTRQGERSQDKTVRGQSTHLEDLHFAGLGDGAHDLVAAVTVLAGAVDVVAMVGVPAEREREIFVHTASISKGRDR